MYDAAWVMREGLPYLLLAGRQGLYEIDLRPKYNPVQVVVDSANLDMGFSAVVAAMDDAGFLTVAVGAIAGRACTFPTRPGARIASVRWACKTRSSRRWPSSASDHPVPVGGDRRDQRQRRRLQSLELRGLQNPPEGWGAFANQWNAGTCNALAFLDRQLVAGSFRGGALLVQPGG